jgi:hypothetical protein
MTQRPRLCLPALLHRPHEGVRNGLEVVGLSDELQSAGVLPDEAIQVLEVSRGQNDGTAVKSSEIAYQLEKMPIPVVRGRDVPDNPVGPMRF